MVLIDTQYLTKMIFKFYYAFLKNKNLSDKTIINKTVKYMRILSSCIADEGTEYNDKDRITYKGTWRAVLPGIEIGETFRVFKWISASENKDVAYKFLQNFDDDDQLIVEFHIKEGCYNAGRINKFGESIYPNEKETLIPPYTVLTLISKEEDYAVLEVAKDNNDHDFNMKVSCV